MNIDRLTILSAHLKTQAPDTFDLDHWFDRTAWSDLPDTITPSCYTCGCIAGDALMLFAPNTPINVWEIPTAARELLDLTPCQSTWLFDPVANPGYDVCYHDEPYALPKGRVRSSITPQEAARVVDHLIETGEVDWRIIR